jgi:hypothetical protein
LIFFLLLRLPVCISDLRCWEQETWKSSCI